MAKRKSKKKVVNKTSYEKNNCDFGWFANKIGAMALILLIITLWDKARVFLLNVPWWVYLIIWIVFCGAAMSSRCGGLCHKK